MGKNIKSYATTSSPFPREREGSLTAKSPKSFIKNTVRLNCTHYSLLQAKFSIFQNCPIKSNSSELRKFRAVRPHSPQITQNLHILLTYSILCFRHLPRQRTLENSSELRRFRTILPHSPRITRIPHTSHYN